MHLAGVKSLLDELELGRSENWVPDSAASTCFKCHVPFTFSQRRHHCRVCGNIFCTKCCSTKSINSEKSVRVCDKCFKLLHCFVEELESAERKRQFQILLDSNEEKAISARLKKMKEEHIARICNILCEKHEIPEEYKDCLISMVIKAVSTVHPSSTIGDEMAFSSYVKIKLTPDKDAQDSRYVNGLVITKNVTDRKMLTAVADPKLLLVNGDLAASKDDIEIDSLRDVAALQTHFTTKIVNAICALNPSMVVVEKSVSIPVLEELRRREITVLSNMKPRTMSRLARLTNTIPCPNANLLTRHHPLGRCSHFSIQSKKRTGKESVAQVDRSYAFFEGCASSLGCTLCVAGYDYEVLKRIKAALKEMLFFGRDIELETAFVNEVNADWRLANGDVYLMDVVGAEAYLAMKELDVVKSYLQQGENQHSISSEDDINNKGRRLCGEPTRLKLKCCVEDEDAPFGEFIVDIMSIINEHCSLCQKKRSTHELRYYHGKGCVKVTALQSSKAKKLQSNDTLCIKGKCKKCKKLILSTAIGKWYEYSLERVMLQYFYNNRLVSKSEECGHSLTVDFKWKVYNKCSAVMVEYEAKELYALVPAEALTSISESYVQLSNSSEVTKNLVNEYYQYNSVKYDKIKTILLSCMKVCPNDKIRRTVQSALNWLEDYLDVLAEQESKELWENCGSKLQMYTIRNNCFLKQFHAFINVLIKACEPHKDAAGEKHRLYTDFSLDVKRTLKEGSILLNSRKISQSLAASEITVELDYGSMVAHALRSREYNDGLRQLLQDDLKTSTSDVYGRKNYERTESELLDSAKCCLRVTMEATGAAVAVLRHNEWVPVNCGPVLTPRSIEDEKFFEKSLTDIIKFRTSIEKEYKVVSEKVSELMKDIHKEQELVYDKVEVSVYYATQFAALRGSLGLDEKTFVQLLSTTEAWKGVSGGKTRKSFWKSRDERLILKFVKKKEGDSFEKYGPKYFKHMCKAVAHQMPSILIKTLGLYKVRVGDSEPHYITVMENLQCGSSSTAVYDLKGSLKRRYVRKEERSAGKVLLDTNFKEDNGGEPLILEEKTGQRLISAIHNDTILLSKMNVMDYSLLAIIDKNERTVKAGIIDIFREFNAAELFEYHTKRAINLGVKPTVIEPCSYKRRFRDAMNKYFLPTVS